MTRYWWLCASGVYAAQTAIRYNFTTAECTQHRTVRYSAVTVIPCGQTAHTICGTSLRTRGRPVAERVPAVIEGSKLRLAPTFPTTCRSTQQATLPVGVQGLESVSAGSWESLVLQMEQISKRANQRRTRHQRCRWRR